MTSRLTPQEIKEESVLFTAPGFKHVGEAKWIDPAWYGQGAVGQGHIVIVIERPRAMDVLSQSHPLPPHALQGTEAVGGVFENMVRTGRR